MNPFKSLMIVSSRKFPFVSILRGDAIFEHAFNEASADVRRMAKLSVEELAKEYADAEIKKNRATCIIIEHILSVRLYKIQSNAAWGAGILALLGMLVGYILR